MAAQNGQRLQLEHEFCRQSRHAQALLCNKQKEQMMAHENFFWITIVNASILFGLRSYGKKMNLKEFRIAVAQGMICQTKKTKLKPNLAQTNSRQLFIPLEKSLTGNLHIKLTWKRCNLCSSVEKQTRSYWTCQEYKCSVKFD